MNNSMSVAPPYSHYNYVQLDCRGIGHLFDTMRYEHAFFARKKDIEEIITAFNATPLSLISRSFSIILCKYTWSSGKKITNWWPQRLLSTMKYNYIDDIEVWNVSKDSQEDQSNFHLAQANPKLKWENTQQFIETFPNLLKSMYHNNACPASEGEARQLEQAIYKNPTDTYIVTLRNFTAVPLELE